MKSAERRYDIDWLRVIAIGLLVIYHAVITFQPWGVFIGFIQNNQSLENMWIPMSMLNVWRIPILFFISGMGVCFAMKKRSWKQLLIERSKRILLPLTFGVLTIVPLHVFIWQSYYNQDLSYMAERAHLWFLANIFVYVIILMPLFYFLKHKRNTSIDKALKTILSSPFSIVLIAIAFVLEAIIIEPEHYEMYAMTWHGFFLGLLAFVFGYLLISNGNEFWISTQKWRRYYLSMALVFFTIRLLIFELEPPHYLIAIESIFWIYAVFGFGHKYLNKPSKTLQYLSKAAYPIYIIHMVFQYLACSFLLPLEINAMLKLTLVITFTFIGSFVVYEFGIKPSKAISFLFGCRFTNTSGYKATISDLNPIDNRDIKQII